MEVLLVFLVVVGSCFGFIFTHTHTTRAMRDQLLVMFAMLERTPLFDANTRWHVIR